MELIAKIIAFNSFLKLKIFTIRFHRKKIYHEPKLQLVSKSNLYAKTFPVIVTIALVISKLRDIT